MSLQAGILFNICEGIFCLKSVSELTGRSGNLTFVLDINIIGVGSG